MPVDSAPLPKGRHAAPRGVVRASQRERMLAAMSAAVAEQTYAAVAVADVIERAGVSRKTFYEHFANREECFLAAFDAAVDLILDAIDAEIRAAGRDAVRAAVAGTRCYLEWLAANPAHARTFLIEVLGAGPRALARRTAVHERFAAQLAAVYATAREQFAELPPRPRHFFRAAVGATNELVTDHLLVHGSGGLPELLPALLDVQLGLLVGTELAERLIAERLAGGLAAG